MEDNMINGELRSKVDKIWETFWTGGITNPLEVIEQYSTDALRFSLIFDSFNFFWKSPFWPVYIYTNTNNGII